MSETLIEQSGQPLLPNERTQAAWFNLLSAIVGARLPSDAHQRYHQALGYRAALQDAELIDAADATLMDTTARRALNDALQRLQTGGGWHMR
ncbi:hypothetical protein K9857_15035 [Pseudomonas sp. REP124]|uniref:hypothetical protein n=1 Tax=Pseudomonas sp. REP124 TaxID=2875731 RepID=UPI001CCF5234|nr:hypothetical protein [Pseudomonas sp. REP124]MBZ9782853.1 hypothetical protein [Pseudomonas sp. REP124]